MGRVVSLCFLLLLASCVGGHRPPPPRTARPATVPDDRATRQCIADLARMDARFQRLPDREFGGQCSAIGTVKLLDIGMPTTNLGAMTCPLAAGFIKWTQEALQKAARAWLDSPIAKVESFGTYSCRRIAGSGHMSEHARSNAVDVSGFVLASGRRITVLRDWNGTDGPARDFLRAVHAAACRRFSVVMGPDANADHRDHFHFDMGAGRACR